MGVSKDSCPGCLLLFLFIVTQDAAKVVGVTEMEEMWIRNNASTSVIAPASEFKAIMSDGWISPESKKKIGLLLHQALLRLLGFALQHSAR